MNERNKNKIKEKLSKIQSNEFCIDDIEILLMNIREFARNNKFLLLLEFCDFVAHPDRNKGIIYDELDILYSKFKYMPTKAGDNLNYNSIEKGVFNILFDKSIDQLTDEFLLEKLNKNSAGLKAHIVNNLVKKEGGVYKAISSTAICELRNIQNILNRNPQIHSLTEDNLFSEIKVCSKNLSEEINFQFDENEFDKIKKNLILCLLEIIQDCKFEMHHGEFGKGFISVSSNNSLYKVNPKTENLNLCFTAQVPIEQSFPVFDVIQTSLFVFQHIPDYTSTIEWLDNNQKFGRLKPFKLNRNHKINDCTNP